MTDPHVHILRLVAHQSQRELVDHDSRHPIGDGASTQRREQLERRAAQTRALASDAQARRRRRTTRSHLTEVSLLAEREDSG